MEGDGKRFGVADALHHEYRKQLEHEGERDEGCHDTDGRIIHADILQQLYKKGIADQKRHEILKGALDQIRLARALVGCWIVIKLILIQNGFSHGIFLLFSKSIDIISLTLVFVYAFLSKK